MTCARSSRATHPRTTRPLSPSAAADEWSRCCEFPEHRDGIPVLRVQLDRLLIIDNRLCFIARVHVTFGEAVVGIAGVGIGCDVELEDTDGLCKFLPANKPVPQAVEFVLIEVVNHRSGGLQIMIL